MIRIGDWFSKAWEIFTKSVGVHIVLALIVGLGSALTIGILAGPLMCGWLYVILRQLREPDYQPEIGDIGKGFEVFGQALLACILIVVGSVVVSFILSVVPILGQLLSIAAGWAIAACVLFVLPLIVDRNTAAIDAITFSFEKVKPAFWGFFGFAVLLSVINGVGSGLFAGGIVLGLVIGRVGFLIGALMSLIGLAVSLVAGPIVVIAQAAAYHDNFGEVSVIELEAPAPPQPPVEPPPFAPPTPPAPQ